MKYKTDRKLINVELVSVDSNSIKDFIERLQNIENDYTKMGFINIQVCIDRDEEPYSDWVGAICNIKGDRWETVEEYEDRVAKEKVRDDRNREYNLRELARLKKELGVD
jgi:predicted NAD-dependent protein-ADP-ribosyltransferase YbiA (DUF1768 family)